MTDFEIYTLDQAVKTAKLSLPHVAFVRSSDGEWNVACRDKTYEEALVLALQHWKGGGVLQNLILEIDVGQDQPSCVYAR